MKTQKNNIKIAEFMGIRYQEDGKWKNSHEDSEYYYEDCELEYHHNWNWIMPVVEKIEREGFKSCIENWFCSFDGNSDETDGIWFENKNPATTKIDAVNQTISEFIDWYNEKQLKK